MTDLPNRDQGRQGVADHLHVDQPKPFLGQSGQLKRQLRHQLPGLGIARIPKDSTQHSMGQDWHAEGAVSSVDGAECCGDTAAVGTPCLVFNPVCSGGDRLTVRADEFDVVLDEHTGLVIDLDAGQAEVTGNGGVTLRVDGESLHHPTGSILDLAILTDRDAVSRTIRGDASTVRATEIADDHASDLATIPASAEQTVESSLADTADRADREFSAAITAGDAATATGVMLELETAIWAWSADTLQSDETDRARQVLRSMVTRLGEAAVAGLADPRAVDAPLVDLLLQLRSDARAEKRFEVSDLIRDRLDETGIEVRDTADGAEWDLRA